MKIMHINASDIGSTGKIIENIIAEADRRGWGSVFAFPRDNRSRKLCEKSYAVSMRYEQGLYRRIYAITGMHYGFAPLSTSKILRIIRMEKPDVVHLHSINCATVNIYRLLNFLKRENIPTVVTNHAEFFYTGSCPHSLECAKWETGCGNCPNLYYATDSRLFDRTACAWKKMKKAFSGFDRLAFVSVSPWVKSRAERSPIVKDYEQRVILNGADTAVFCDSGSYKDDKKLRTVVHVTANFSDEDRSKKGGAFIIELAKRMEHDNIRFVVVGPYSVKEPAPDNITFTGKILDQKKLSNIYASADLCVVTSRKETFGMTVAEALCCGTPVVGFQSGGSESIALEEHSEFVPFGDTDALEAAVRKWIGFKNEDNSAIIASEAANMYSGERMAREYCDLYTEMRE